MTSARTPPNLERAPGANTARSRAALVAGLASLACLAALTVTVLADRHDPVAQDADEAWRDMMASTNGDALTWLAKGFDIAGKGYVAVVLVLVVLGLMAARRMWRTAALVSLAATVTLIVNPLLKLVVERQRPPGHLVEASGYAFPSGHAAFGAAFCASLALALAPRRARWLVLAALLAAAMMWSRTYLSVHWLSDTLAGALLGFGVALIVFWALPPATTRTR